MEDDNSSVLISCAGGVVIAPKYLIHLCGMPRKCGEYAEGRVGCQAEGLALDLRRWPRDEVLKLVKCLAAFEGGLECPPPPLASLLDYLSPPAGFWKFVIGSMRWTPEFPISPALTQALGNAATVGQWLTINPNNLRAVAEWMRRAGATFSEVVWRELRMRAGGWLGMACARRLYREITNTWTTNRAGHLGCALSFVVASRCGVPIVGEMRSTVSAEEHELVVIAQALPWALFSPEAQRVTLEGLLRHKQYEVTFVQKVVAAAIACGAIPLSEVAEFANSFL